MQTNLSIKKVILILIGLSISFTRDLFIYIFYGVTFIAIVFWIFMRPKHKINNAFLNDYLLFVLYTIGSISWSISKESTLSMIITLVINIILILIVNDFIDKQEDLEYILAGMKISIYFNFILFVFFKSYLFDIETRFSGTFSNSNMLGFFVCVVVLLIKSISRKKNSNIIFYLLCFALIISTQSRKAFILGVVVVLGIIVDEFRAKVSVKHIFFLIPMLAGLLAAGILVLNNIFAIPTISRIVSSLSIISNDDPSVVDSSTKWRLYFLTIAFNIFKEHIVFGAGLNTVQYLIGGGIYSHNNFIEILACLGIVGFFLFYRGYFRIYSLSGSLSEGLFLITFFILQMFMVVYYERIYLIMGTLLYKIEYFRIEGQDK